jgi:methionyl-tRNA formyltransferase
MGTPEAAVPTLQRCLDDGHEVVAVWTQPDRPAGRHQEIIFSPVKRLALSRGLIVHQPARVKTVEAKELFASHEAEAAVVVAYGRILPEEFLRAPRRGCINVHFSLLPLYRGAAPVNWAIVNGETETGETTIGERETAPQLMKRLAMNGAELLSETMKRITEITPRPQHDRDATFAPLLRKGDGQIEWSNDAQLIERCVRGFQPWPNAYTKLNSRGLTIWNAEVTALSTPAAVAGEILVAHGDELIVKCGGQTALRLLEVQPEAKRRMSVRDFLNGIHLKVGDHFGKG